MEYINNKRKYNLSPFDHVFSCRNCRGGIYFSWCVLKVTGVLGFLLLYQGGSCSLCLHPNRLILTHHNCIKRRQKNCLHFSKTLPLLLLNENVSSRAEEIPWYNSFRSFRHSILLLLAFPDQSPLSNLLLQRLGRRTDTCTTSSAACKIHTEYYLQKLFTIYSISTKTWKNLKRRRIFTKFTIDERSRRNKNSCYRRRPWIHETTSRTHKCNACLLGVNTADIQIAVSHSRPQSYCLRLLLSCLPLFWFIHEKHVGNASFSSLFLPETCPRHHCSFWRQNPTWRIDYQWKSEEKCMKFDAF